MSPPPQRKRANQFHRRALGEKPQSGQSGLQNDRPVLGAASNSPAQIAASGFGTPARNLTRAETDARRVPTASAKMDLGPIGLEIDLNAGRVRTGTARDALGDRHRGRPVGNVRFVRGLGIAHAVPKAGKVQPSGLVRGASGLTRQAREESGTVLSSHVARSRVLEASKQTIAPAVSNTVLQGHGMTSDLAGDHDPGSLENGTTAEAIRSANPASTAGSVMTARPGLGASRRIDAMPSQELMVRRDRARMAVHGIAAPTAPTG